MKDSRSQLPYKEIIKSIHKIIGDSKNFCIWYFKGTYIFICFAIEGLVTVSQAHLVHAMSIST